MNRNFIKKAFKGIDKENIPMLISKSCDIIRTYYSEHGVDVSSDYYQRGLGWKLSQNIQNRRGKDTPYSLSLDYIMTHITTLQLQLEMYDAG